MLGPLLGVATARRVPSQPNAARRRRVRKARCASAAARRQRCTAPSRQASPSAAAVSVCPSAASRSSSRSGAAADCSVPRRAAKAAASVAGGGAEQVSASATTGIAVVSSRRSRCRGRRPFGPGLAAPGLLLVMPCQDGALENPSPVAHLPVQGDVAGFDPGHDVGAGDADQVCRSLSGENRVHCRFGLGGRRPSGVVGDRRVLDAR